MIRKLTKILSTTLVAALAIALPIGYVSADAKPTSIKIISKSQTVDVGKTLELDSVVSPYDAEDDNIVWTSSNSKIAQVLDKYDDDTKIKGIEPGTVTITAKVQDTNISATYKVTVKKATASSSTSASSNKMLDDFDKEIDQLEKAIEAVKLSSTRSGQRKQYYSLEKQMEDLNDRMDDYEDKLEDQYDRGSVSRTNYRNLEKAFDKLDDKLDKIEDLLEYKFDIDD